MVDHKLVNTTQATDANALTRVIPWREYWANNRTVGTQMPGTWAVSSERISE